MVPHEVGVIQASNFHQICLSRTARANDLACSSACSLVSMCYAIECAREFDLAELLEAGTISAGEAFFKLHARR
jgi:hypothetical protein